MTAAEPISRPASIAIGAAKCRPRTRGISLSEMDWVSRRAWTCSTNVSVAAKASAMAHHGSWMWDR